MKQAIMIGAGNIGRGFIGAILSRSGYHVTFADVNMTLIDAINAEGRYTVHIQDRNPAAFTITNIDGISSAGPELAEALKTAEQKIVKLTAVEEATPAPDELVDRQGQDMGQALSE